MATGTSIFTAEAHEILQCLEVSYHLVENKDDIAILNDSKSVKKALQATETSNPPAPADLERSRKPPQRRHENLHLLGPKPLKNPGE